MADRGEAFQNPLTALAGRAHATADMSAGAAPRLVAHELSASAWAGFAPTWEALYRNARERSFFVSTAWVEAWLSVYGEVLHPQLAAFEDHGGEVVGACLLVARRGRRGFVPVRQLHFHTAGEDSGEAVCPEYVAPLCGAGSEAAVAAAFARHLEQQPWDEFLAGGLTPAAYDALARSLRGARAEVVWSQAPYVDLAALRATGTAYEAALSGNTREQLRRSLRLYAERGDVRLEPAETPDAALRMLDELGALHQAAWQARGQRGAFGSPRWRTFHERLVRGEHAPGRILLARAAAGDEPIGLIYGFVDGRRVLFYQSGLRYESDNRYKPGLVTHFLAIQFCLSRGFDEYDFLAGEPEPPRYKTSLANAHRLLAWAVFERDNRRMRLVTVLREMKHRLRQVSAGSKRP